MAKREFSDRMLKALKPAPAGQRYEIWDTDPHAKGLGIRVTAAGTRTFVLMRRFPGSTNPVRRALGEYGEISLLDARQRARDWIAQIRAGNDPATEKQRKQAEADAKQTVTFGAVAEDFFAEKCSTEREGKKVERDIRREFLKRWESRSISDITDLDVLAVIRTVKKRGAVSSARNLLGTISRLFGWVIDQRVYGLKINPCQGLKASKLFGDKKSRDRILTEDELYAFLRAIRRMPYPYGPMYRLLILTGLRLNEVADAAWSEFDFKGNIWIIPAARMKGKDSKARPHTVPLTSDIHALLADLPRFKSGTFLFSSNYGVSPIWAGSRSKARLDARMLRTLKAMARIRGDDPANIVLDFCNHDLRRTLRSGLSAMRFPRDVCEAVLAHTPPGIVAVYDRHDFLVEKHQALDAWAKQLRSILEPESTPGNVVALKVPR
jgi:integrase